MRRSSAGWPRSCRSDALWLVTPLRRTRQTAEALFAAGAPLPAELREEPDFLEQHFGSWQGLTYDELAVLRDGAAHRFWHAPAVERPPGGESFADVVARVASAVRRISPAAAGRDLVVVAHGGSIRAALAHALGHRGGAGAGLCRRQLLADPPGSFRGR